MATEQPPTDTPTASSTAPVAPAAVPVPTAPTDAAPGTTSGAAPETVDSDGTPVALKELVLGFESYNFSGDDAFRTGLPAVIKALKGGRKSTAADIDDIIARAQWFYYTRLKGSAVPFETYLKIRTHETESRPMKSPMVSTSALPTEPEAPAYSEGSISVTAAPPTPPTGHLARAPDEMTFNDVVRLIAAGRAGEVPTQDIPDGINEAAPSVSTMSARPKPWESSGEATAVDSAVESATHDHGTAPDGSSAAPPAY